jgi:glutamine amidotransferase
MRSVRRDSGMSQVTIIDYGSGNLHSISKAVELVVPKGMCVVVSNKPRDIAKASHIILPGVGAFGDCIQGLESQSGVKEALSETVQGQQKPFLGICVGMQMLAEEGTEHGVHKGLGWIKGRVEPINPADKNLKVPHMGWNELIIQKSHPILAGIENGSHAYFVHSFYLNCLDKADVLVATQYGIRLTAVVARGNIVATQFHPEKSQKTGLRLLENFVRM